MKSVKHIFKIKQKRLYRDLHSIYIGWEPATYRDMTNPYNYVPHGRLKGRRHNRIAEYHGVIRAALREEQ